MILAQTVYRNVSPLLKQVQSLPTHSLQAVLPRLASSLKFNRNLELQLAIRLSSFSLISPQLVPHLSSLRVQNQDNQIHRIVNYTLEKLSGKEPQPPSSVQNFNNLDQKFLERLGPALPIALLLNPQANLIPHLKIFSKPLVQLITARILEGEKEVQVQEYLRVCKQTKNWDELVKVNLQKRVLQIDPQLQCDWECPLLYSFFQVWLYDIDLDKYLFLLSADYQSKLTPQRKFTKNFIQACHSFVPNPYRIRLQAEALRVPIPQKMQLNCSLPLDPRQLSLKDCQRLEQEDWGREILRSLSKDFKEVVKVNLQLAIYLSSSIQHLKNLGPYIQKMNYHELQLFRFKQFSLGQLNQNLVRPVPKLLQIQFQKASLLGGVDKLDNVEWSRLGGWLHRNRESIKWPKDCRQRRVLQTLCELKESELQLYKYQKGQLTRK